MVYWEIKKEKRKKTKDIKNLLNYIWKIHFLNFLNVLPQNIFFSSCSLLFYLITQLPLPHVQSSSVFFILRLYRFRFNYFTPPNSFHISPHILSFLFSFILIIPQLCSTNILFFEYSILNYRKKQLISGSVAIIYHHATPTSFLFHLDYIH